MSNFIYKILSPQEHQHLMLKTPLETQWKGAEIDVLDGFIHFSTLNQVAVVANKYFSQFPLIYILKFNSEDLGQHLKWEGPEQTEKTDPNLIFPHLYAALNLNLASVSKISKIDKEFDLSTL